MCKLIIFSISYSFKDFLFKRWFIITILSALIINIYSAVMPTLAGIGFQRLPESKTSSELAVSIMLTAGLFVVLTLLENIDSHIKFRFHTYATQATTLDLISAVQNNSLYNIKKYSSGELINKIKRMGMGIAFYLDGLIMGIMPLFIKILVMFFYAGFYYKCYYISGIYSVLFLLISCCFSKLQIC